MIRLDIVIPVYNEGDNIIEVLESLRKSVKTSFRVLVCYDDDGDDTLLALRRYKQSTFDILLVKNPDSGVHSAVVAGFKTSSAPAVLVFPADDTYNARIIDSMVQKIDEGFAIVAASRFAKGGRMVGCPWVKFLLVRLSAFVLYHFAGVPTRDASNGFRLFSRKVLESLEIESREGFSYSIELLVKCHRLGWKIGEVPALWFERKKGRSRFRIIKWLPGYLRWFFYAFATTYLSKRARTVTLREGGKAPSE